MHASASVCAIGSAGDLARLMETVVCTWRDGICSVFGLSRVWNYSHALVEVCDVLFVHLSLQVISVLWTCPVKTLGFSVLVAPK